MAAVQLSLDYPAINCRQCRQNLEEDEIEPDCKSCPVSKWEGLTIQLLALHDRVCPWGDMVMSAVAQAMDDLEIKPSDRRLARRCLVSIHRTMKHHQKQQSAGNHADN
jgi:hypothetical protein